jgi:hypothetical protein
LVTETYLKVASTAEFLLVVKMTHAIGGADVNLRFKFLEARSTPHKGFLAAWSNCFLQLAGTAQMPDRI